MKSKFNFLNEFEIRAIAREGWRRQLIADERLARKLAQSRLIHDSPLAIALDAPGTTRDLFHAKPDK